jgi:hypothetical protein
LKRIIGGEKEKTCRSAYVAHDFLPKGKYAFSSPFFVRSSVWYELGVLVRLVCVSVLMGEVGIRLSWLDRDVRLYIIPEHHGRVGHVPHEERPSVWLWL